MPSAYLLHRQSKKSSLRHFFELMALTVSFLILSGVAVFNSLGYHINTQARVIERSGGVAVSIRNNVPATVILDGKTVGVTPIRVSDVYPGQHTVRVASDGYQSFTTDLSVTAGNVTAFRDIFLVLTHPKSVPVDPNWLPIVSVYDDPSLQIKSDNELWQNGLFLTRTSQDILQARYSSQTRQIIYQEGTTLWLFTPSSQTTVLLLKSTTQIILPFDLRENGRILLYQGPDSDPQALSLY